MRRIKHPGEHLHQYLIREKIDVESFAAKMGIEAPMLQEFISCKFSADSDFANRLHAATGVSVGCWLNLQSRHDESLKS